MSENIEATPVNPALGIPSRPFFDAPKPPVEAPKPTTAKSEAPAPGTPEFAAWAWENRNG